MKYTIKELRVLKEIRLRGFNQKQMLDDEYTNKYWMFDINIDTFLDWLEKMEKENKIEHLLEHDKTNNKEYFKCLKTIAEYEENCANKCDKFMIGSYSPVLGERLIDFACRNKINDFKLCEKLHTRYTLKEAKEIIAKIENGG